MPSNPKNEESNDPSKDRPRKNPSPTATTPTTTQQQPTTTSPPPAIQRTSSLQSHTSSLKTVAEHPGMTNRRPPPSNVTDLDVELCPEAVKQKGFDILNSELGEGKFSKVYKATQTNKEDKTVKQIAVKLIRFDNVESEWREVQLKNELKITRKLCHDNIIHIIEVIKTKRRAFIFMEKAEYSLDDVLKKATFKDGLPEAYCQGFSEEILRALCYLHGDKKIAHRDLKTDNILLDKNNHCKLTDFGFATYIRPTDNDNRDVKELSKTVCGTPDYMAPELHAHQDKKYDAAAADMWSFGVILFEMIYNRLPFPIVLANGEQRSTEELLKLMKDPIKPPMNWNGKQISKEARDLIKGLIELDPKKRLTAEKALASPWFKMKFENDSNPKDDKKSPRKK